MGGYILAILSKIILKQGNIWDIQKVKQKGYLRKNLTQKEKEMNKALYDWLDKVEGKKYSTYKFIKKLIKEERKRK
tara:strand:- start:216 stop:443 length:228 start_codon:yes stop_codon:yes gene_type:complete